jgi:glutaredoxin
MKKQATLYRMVMPGHTCPYGLKSLHLLKKHGYSVQDNHLTTREETDAFKAEYNVETTPQAFIGDERIGGYTELRKHFGQKVLESGDTTYKPVVAIFAVGFLLAIAVGFLTNWSMGYVMVLSHFISITMVLLALMKLRDVEGFSTMFLNYDVLAKRWVPYGYIYPYAELTAGLLMFAGVLSIVSIPLALFIGGIGAWSVFKAVYLEKRELKCACVGGDTNVPLGFVSLSENLMMLGMAVWMGVMLIM